VEEVSGELAEKQKELREVNKEHEKEELKLQHGRENDDARQCLISEELAEFLFQKRDNPLLAHRFIRWFS
jgi:hypothetical protein